MGTGAVAAVLMLGAFKGPFAFHGHMTPEKAHEMITSRTSSLSGSTVGVITAEDALEQIVGELQDEFDVAEPASLLSAGGPLTLSGSENLRDLETRDQLALPRDRGFETLAGFVLWRLGRIPSGGETFEFEGHRFTVLSMEGKRVGKVKVESLAVVSK